MYCSAIRICSSDTECTIIEYRVSYSRERERPLSTNYNYLERLHFIIYSFSSYTHFI
jgi:hypothetical protein